MEIPLKGNIREISLAKILVWLNRERKTGTLSLLTPEFTKMIYMNRGDAIFASSTYEDDRLGEMLLKAGKITVAQYDKSVEILKTSEKRHGAILTELEYLKPKDLFWGVKYQVKEIIHSLFQLEDASYEFIDNDVPRDEVITLKMSMGNLIYEGVKRIDNWTRMRNEIPDTDSILKLSEDPLSLFQDIELSSQDKKILSLIDGKRTIGDVIENSWIGSFDSMKILYVLWSIEMVEQTATIQPEAAPAEQYDDEYVSISIDDILKPMTDEEALLKRVDSFYLNLDKKGPSELLEIDTMADTETVKKNYFRLTKEFHPDRYYSFDDTTVKTKLTAVFDAITKAYNILRDEKEREAYLKSTEGPQRVDVTEDAAGEAEKHFKEGIEAFKKSNFLGATDNFKLAIKMMPKGANYWSYLSLAYSKIPEKLKEAEEALLTAIKLEPFNADYQANLGLLYMKAGLKKRANSTFKKALKIEPNNEKAKKGLAQTGE
jgi:curved DNA-binding protein CbpA